ncbi:hypothetical protein [Mycolicibacter icosiumassiliensis]|uniref:hypothetical protein n=1 Tax=Mycolicibacter icosiumassiliensis TaxID=1792835 RepID=UPI000AEF00C9|nr:hypothetical protein [Mycolicibacter icosiumassiliensis]
MPALATLPAAASTDIDGEFNVEEFARGEFYSDDFGLVTAPPPLTIAAALAATTVAVTALMGFAVGEIAGRYAARGGAR